MFKLKSDNIIKGMVFAGCSFTWGQGLYFYSNLKTLEEPKPHHYDHNLVNEAHLAYMRSVRYPRIVANYFNTYELTQPFNGGSHESIINWWKVCFSKNSNCNIYSNFPVTKLDYSDVSHLIFQFTQPHRCPIILSDKNNKPYQISFCEVFEEPHRDNFTEWLTQKNITLDQYKDYYITESTNKVKDFLKQVENHGIKIIVFTWPEENVKFIKNDNWLNQRFMNFDYNNSNYDSIAEMMSANPELEILRDTDNFCITPGDHHPSKKCHQVMAENVIKYLKNI